MKTAFNIPNPCSEDWSKMTPTEKGAYCDKCQFEVIDFTAMEPEEIKATLKAQAGKKTCGHVSKVQLEMVNSDYHLWENQTVSIFRSKFLYACLMVFGFTLFTSCGDGHGNEHDLGEIEPVGMIEDVGTITEDTIIGDTIVFDDSMGCDVIEGDIIDGMVDFDLGEIEAIEE